MRNEWGAYGADDCEMRGSQNETLDAVTAERLLDGTGGGRFAVAELLARAAGPARAAELSGEAAALVAFRSTAPSPVHTPARRASRRRWLVAVAAAILTFASAGAAVAAATGVIPDPFRQPTVSAPEPSDPGPSLAAGPSNVGATHGPSSAPPDEAIGGLCRAYLAQVAAGHGDELRNPRFDALTTLAGGADRVPAYCAARVAEPSPEPTRGRSDDHPTGRPSPPAANPNQPAK